MPNRVIREVGLTSRKLAAASDFGERLYWRLYQAVDDFGRYHGDPQLILGRCFPLMTNRLKPKHVQKGRDELARLGLILLYRAGNDEIVQITKFNQRVRSVESKFPAPQEGQVTVTGPSDDGLDRDRDRESKTKTDPPQDGGDGSHVTVSDFEKFYQAYPLHKARDRAERAFRAALKRGATLDEMLAAVTRQLAEREGLEDRGQFVPAWKHPASWLNAGCWNDESSIAEPEESEAERRFRQSLRGEPADG